MYDSKATQKAQLEQKGALNLESEDLTSSDLRSVSYQLYEFGQVTLFL